MAFVLGKGRTSAVAAFGLFAFAMTTLAVAILNLKMRCQKKKKGKSQTECKYLLYAVLLYFYRKFTWNISMENSHGTFHFSNCTVVCLDVEENNYIEMRGNLCNKCPQEETTIHLDQDTSHYVNSQQRISHSTFPSQFIKWEVRLKVSAFILS